MARTFASQVMAPAPYSPAPRMMQHARSRGAGNNVILILLAIVVLQGPVASFLRIAGYYLSDEQIGDTIWSDASSAILASLGLISASLVGLRIKSRSILVAICFFGVLLILIGNYISGNEYLERLDHWNSPADEISRSAFIFLLYTLLATWNPQAKLSTLIRSAYIYVIIMISMFVISLLQRYEILPNFYFQWVRGVHMPRPAGGMNHPHFYAALNAVGIACVLYLNRVRSIRSVFAVLISTIFLIGSAISTSRAGFIFTGIVFAIFCVELKNGTIGSRYITRGLVGLWALLLLAVLLYAFDIAAVEQYYSMFFLFMEQDSGILRGRGDYWMMELDLIFRDLKTSMFGYGFQPMVSHNLILRQLQATGIIGTMLYACGIIALFLDCVRRTSPKLRICAYMCAVPVALASATLPILVSTAVNAALLLVLGLLIGSSEGDSDPRPRPGIPPTKRRRIAPSCPSISR